MKILCNDLHAQGAGRHADRARIPDRFRHCSGPDVRSMVDVAGEGDAWAVLAAQSRRFGTGAFPTVGTCYSIVQPSVLAPSERTGEKADTPRCISGHGRPSCAPGRARPSEHRRARDGVNRYAAFKRNAGQPFDEYRSNRSRNRPNGGPFAPSGTRTGRRCPLRVTKPAGRADHRHAGRSTSRHSLHGDVPTPGTDAPGLPHRIGGLRPSGDQNAPRNNAINAASVKADRAVPTATAPDAAFTQRPLLTLNR